MITTEVVYILLIEQGSRLFLNLLFFLFAVLLRIETIVGALYSLIQALRISEAIGCASLCEMFHFMAGFCRFPVNSF